MVTLRGIDVSIVSQFDVRRLPEYNVSAAGPLAHPSTSCFVPIHPGSQIWCDYSIFNPHPSSAIYLFKLIVNGEVITAWDCTERNGYHGKAAYLLHHADQRDGRRAQLQQRVLAFSSQPDSNSCVIEVRVYRVATRHRTHPSQQNIHTPSLQPNTGLKMTGTRPVELDRPVRRYEYRLLDAKDEPYASFYFHPRTVEYLEKHALLNPSTSGASSLSATTTETENIYYDMNEDFVAAAICASDSAEQIAQRCVSPTSSPDSMSSTASDTSTVIHHIQPLSQPQSQPANSITNNDTQESVQKASVTERKPATTSCQPEDCDLAIDPGTTKLKPERLSRKRSLSPFTSGGFLRRAANSRSCTPENTGGVLSTDSGTEKRTTSAQSEYGLGWTQAKNERKVIRMTSLEGKGGKQAGRTERRWLGLGFMRGRNEDAE